MTTTRKQKANIAKGVSVIIVTIVIITAPWILNAVKFVGCDFKSDYRCEAIHGIGLFIPPAAFVTVWFDGDED